eukprot:gene6016-8286_t
MSSLKKYKRVKYLGKGSYGAAILVELKSNPAQKFVIKEIIIGHLKPTEQAAAKNEAEVLHQMSHSNITMYIESFVEASKLYIVMEHADGGDLSGAVQKRKTENKFWTEEEVMRIFVQICLALKHVHDQNILHRDLKSQNIFLTQKGVVKLGDFGIAKVLDAPDDQARTQIGTPYYLSPEICESKPYGRKSDVWSLGVVLYELVALELPFQATSLPQLVTKICNAEPNYSKIESKYSPTIITLTRSMLLKNSDKRPSVLQIVKTDFIKSHISRLLSYTLKVGNGGVNPSEPSPADLEAEKNMQKARQRLKDIETQKEEREKLAQAQIAQTQGESAKEKMKKFKQDMIGIKKRSSEGRNNDANDNDNISDEDDNHSQAKSDVDSDKQRQGEKEVGPGKRYGDPPKVIVSNQAKQVAGVREFPPVVYSRQQQQQQQSQAVIQISSNNRPKSLAELKMERQREMDAIRQAAGELGGGAPVNPNNGGKIEYKQETGRGRGEYNPHNNNNNNGQNEYDNAARREYFASRAAALAVKAKVEQYERGGGGGMRRDDSNNALVAVGNKGGNRNDVQVDLNRMDPEQRIAYLKSQREKEKQLELALKEQQLKEAYEENREQRKRFENQRRNSDPDAIPIYGGPSQGQGQVAYFDLNRMDPEERIAYLKAQKEIEKEKEIAQKEQELKQAYEMNRQQRKQQENAVGNGGRSKAIAFEIDLDDDNIATPPVRISNSHSNDVGIGMNKKKNNDDKESQPHQAGISYDTPQQVAKQRKGWGPPIAVNELDSALRVKQPSRAVDLFEPPHDQNVRQSLDNDDVSVVNEGELDDDEVLKRLETKRASQIQAREQAKDIFRKLREKKAEEAQKNGGRAGKRRIVQTGNSASPGPFGPPSDASPMRLRLQEVMSKVDIANESVQKALEANNGGRIQLQNKRSPLRGGRNIEENNVNISGNDILAEPKVNDNNKDNNNNNNNRRGSKADQKLSDLKNDNRGDAKEGVVPKSVPRPLAHEKDSDDDSEVEEDLQNTLDVWLTKQKRNVTVRKKPVGNRGGMDGDEYDIVDEDRSMIGYNTLGGDNGAGFGVGAATLEIEDDEDFMYHIAKPDAQKGVRGSILVENQDNIGEYVENDVEVVGFQCMLAEALMMGVDDDEDTRSDIGEL